MGAHQPIEFMWCAKRAPQPEVHSLRRKRAERDGEGVDFAPLRKDKVHTPAPESAETIRFHGPVTSLEKMRP